MARQRLQSGEKCETVCITVFSALATYKKKTPSHTANYPTLE